MSEGDKRPCVLDGDRIHPRDAFIGTKIVKASEMTKQEFEYYKTRKVAELTEEDSAGYLVEYTDGYQSWCPKDTFERFNRNIQPSELAMLGVHADSPVQKDN